MKRAGSSCSDVGERRTRGGGKLPLRAKFVESSRRGRAREVVSEVANVESRPPFIVRGA